MKKRFLAFLLALAMVLTMAPAVFAADEAAAETQTVEAAPAETTEPAAPAEQPAEPAATDNTAIEPAAEPAQTADVQAEPTAEEPVAQAEEPVFDLARNGDPDCYCGGWHNGEYGHICEKVEWTDVTDANKGDYWTGAAIDANVGQQIHLRLQQDLTVKATLYCGKSQAPELNAGTVLSIDLNGHTLTQTGGRVGNVYAGTTFNICDSSAEHTGKIVSSASNGTSSTIAAWGAPTEANTTYINLWGGQITNTRAQAVPAITLNPAYTVLSIFEGAELTGFTNTTATSTNPNSASTLNVRPSAIAITGNGSGLNMYGGKITNCTTGSQGGAIAMRAVSTSACFINLEKGEISGCTAGFNGGAIFMQNGTLTIRDGMLIDGNTVTIGTTDAEKIRSNCYGGAIYKDNGILEMTGGTISNNTSGNGGAMYLYKGTNTISGGTISGNVASGRFESSNGVPNSNHNSYGGAIYYDGTTTEGATLDITGGTFIGNESSAGGGALRFNGLGGRVSGGTITGNVARTTDGGAMYIAATGTVVDITGGTITGNISNRTASDNYRVAGITIRNNPTVNISGSVKIYENFNTNGGAEVNVSAVNGTGLRTINVGELTGDGYFSVTGALNEAKATLNDAGLTQTTRHEKGNDVAYFGPAYTTDTGVNDYEITLDLTTGTQYAVGDMLAYDVYAKISDEATADSVCLQSIMAKVTTEGTGAVTINDVNVNNAYNGESIALYMWTDDTLTAPLQLTKTAQKIGTVYGTPSAEGTVTITTEIEVANTAFSAPVTKQATQTVTIGQKVEHTHCYCGGNCTTGDHEHDTTPHEWTAINASNADAYFKASLVGENGQELYFFLNSDITITKRMYVGDSAGTANGAASSLADVTIHLCLNGHTINVEGDCAFGLNSGKLTICDCSEGQTGKVIAKARTSGSVQAGRIFFVPNLSANTGEFRNICEIYSGTFTQASDTTASSHGLAYIARKAAFRVYGGTFDGNNVASTSASSTCGGLLSVTGASELSIYGGTFQNGRTMSTTSTGGAIYVVTTPFTCKNASFLNNHTDNNEVGAGAIYDNAGYNNAELTSTYENVTFSGNTAGELERNVTFANGEKTYSNTEFGVIKVCGDVVVSFPATQKIDRAYKLTSKAQITYTGIAPGTTLSAETLSTDFTDTDAAYFVLADSTATAVKSNEGALVAVKEEASTIAWAKNEFTMQYNGATYAFSAEDTTVTGSTGAVTYTYYETAESEEAIAAPVEAGTYYVTATVAADLEHSAATTQTRATLTITELPVHKHCICGGNFTIVDHTEHDETIEWTPVSQATIGQINNKTFIDGENHYFYLIGDVTLMRNMIIGNKDSGVGHVFLDLNGHTMTSHSNRVFDFRQGTATICDCVGTGKIIADPDAEHILTFSSANLGMPSAGTIFFWQGSSYGKPDSTTLNIFGGTFENKEGLTNPGSHGFMYATNGGVVNIYAGTFDGKGVKGAQSVSKSDLDAGKSNNGGGLLSGYSATLNIYGGTFKNGSAYSYGGALSMNGTATKPGALNIYGGTFENNVATVAGNNVYVGAATYYSEASVQDVIYASTATITSDTFENEQIKLLSASSNVTIQDVTLAAGTTIDLNGGTLTFDGTAVVDLTLKTSADCGKIKFSANMNNDEIDGILGAIAANCAKLDAADRCLPLLSFAEDNEYTVCKLENAAMICPAVQRNNEDGTYKFRMMPRFLSQTAYDILKETTDDSLKIGFAVSANGGEEQFFEFTNQNVNDYFAQPKDTYVFYVFLAGLESGQTVTLKPYIRLNGQIVYQGTEAPAIVTYTVG